MDALDSYITPEFTTGVKSAIRRHRNTTGSDLRTAVSAVAKAWRAEALAQGNPEWTGDVLRVAIGRVGGQLLAEEERNHCRVMPALAIPA